MLNFTIRLRNSPNSPIHTIYLTYSLENSKIKALRLGSITDKENYKQHAFRIDNNSRKECHGSELIQLPRSQLGEASIKIVALLQIVMIDHQNQWHKCLKKDLTCVLDPQNNLGAIYISSLPTAQHLPLLESFHINSVISAAKGVRLALITSSLRRHLILPAQDNASYDISQFFDETYLFIEKTRGEGNVLVHCMAGVSRSAAIVAAYMIRKYNLTATEAVSRLQDRRGQICPNPGFMLQLKKLEEDVLKIHLNHSIKRTGRAKTEQNDKSSSHRKKIPFAQACMGDVNVLTEKTAKKDSQKFGASTLLAKDYIKQDDVVDQSMAKSQLVQEGLGEKRKSRTLQKIERMKANMVVNMVNEKLQSSANFGKLLKSNIYRNKLKIR